MIRKNANQRDSIQTKKEGRLCAALPNDDIVYSVKELLTIRLTIPDLSGNA